MRTAMQQFILRIKDAQEVCQAPTMKVIFKVAIDEAEALLEHEQQQIRLAYVEGSEDRIKEIKRTSTEYFNQNYNQINTKENA
jgi:hypothetical protein